ncbi:hypothetical protein [Sporosarcina sp. FSL K6-1508]|uniref:hypothetical protein n=1 Tax=Sporosarcina sp. FSL K6-1508 TaxID=2921553 RepID=UPI0030F88502
MFRPNQISDDFVLQKVDAEPFVEGTKGFWLNFINAYREYVNTHLEQRYEEFPSHFPYMKKLQWITVFGNSEIRFYIYEDKTDGITWNTLQFHNYGDYKAFHHASQEVRNAKMQSMLDRDDQPLVKQEISYGFIEQSTMEASKDPSDLAEMGKLKGRMLAKQHGDELKKVKEERFNVFDLEELVPKVNSKSFEYELGESIAAYKQGLYLAAGSTAGIALENILRIIISKKLKGYKLDERTYIWISVKALQGKNIVPGRLLGEASRFEAVRNSNAHTNEDPARKETVEAIYLLIKDLIPFTL